MDRATSDVANKRLRDATGSVETQSLKSVRSLRDTFQQLGLDKLGLGFDLRGLNPVNFDGTHVNTRLVELLGTFMCKIKTVFAIAFTTGLWRQALSLIDNTSFRFSNS